MAELEREWSYEDALDAHVVLDVLDAAEAEAHARAEAERHAPNRRP